MITYQFCELNSNNTLLFYIIRAATCCEAKFCSAKRLIVPQKHLIHSYFNQQ